MANKNKNQKNNRKSKNEMKNAYGVAHRIARWMGRGDGYQIDYINNDTFYPQIIAKDDFFTKSAIDLGEETPDLVLFISHDGWLVKRNMAAVPDEDLVEPVVITFEEEDNNTRPEAFRRTIDLVEEAAGELNKRFPKEDFLRQPKDAVKPKVLVFADFPLLAAQLLIDECPQVDCFYADNSFYPKGKLGIRMCVAAYEASQKISAQHNGWARMGARLLKKPKVGMKLSNF